MSGIVNQSEVKPVANRSWSQKILFFIFLVLLIDLPIQFTKIYRRHSQKSTSAELADLLKSNAIERSDIVETEWVKIRDFSNRDLRATLHNKMVRISGYMVPLEDNVNNVTEFLLVPSQLACIHVPPPPLNQTIFVTMQKGKTAMPVMTPVTITGRFFLFSGKKDRIASFGMDGLLVEPYKSI